MSTSRMGGPIRAGRRGVWAGIAAFGLFGAVGCQVEYAGMTLPTGKYLYDDVQYFAEGPHFPWANTLAATQRAQMQAQGIEPYGSSPAAGMAPAGGLTPPVGTMLERGPGGADVINPAQGVPPITAPPAGRLQQPEMVPPPGPGF
ncbi:hypothetical protein [Tautonia sociabilis]|uniref:Uncharacterized protein n=1 Tax=Tautonia sociabilis TaxID=2080755 RepID=A0A432MHK9_9BACT|nr:hypothetical protein [Tautonia sociabilis]RUL86304.1 hypothetical protein TsocGM_16375 [Tautonia sociabilis]